MTDLVGRRLGDFDVVRELGRGGMGVVYEAMQVSLNRRVALKVLGSGLGLTPKAVDRFRREAESAAKLHHTNIVPVYATGHEQGLHFYAMELIDGPSLDRVVKDLANRERERPEVPDPRAAHAPGSPLDLTGPYVAANAITPSGSSSGLGSDSGYFDAVARMVADVADALHHAHQNSVIHRDIKPSNLLLSPDGRLSVNDFGLARVLEQPGMTVTGEFVGTPAYMAPEQIAGGRVPVDHRCDIYSLGATLYELLTLRPPFTADSRDRLLAMVLQKEPTPPRSINPKVPRDLETICLKCLEKDPDRRYTTAKDLADDLRRYVNRFAILARRVGPLGKLKKWVRRNPALTGAAIAVVLALGAAGAFAWQAHESEQRRLAEEKRQDDERRAERREAALEKALQLALSGDLGGAERSIGEAELLGASAGDVRLMRGQIAYYRGDFATAIEHLEQGVRLQPQRAAPRALLAAACTEFGSFERYYEMMNDLTTLTPETYEDFLFFGLAVSFENPERGLAAMDEAIRRRDSSVARALRSKARGHAAMGNGNLADAEMAVEDARVAVTMLPGDPFALAQSVMANLVAAGIYEQHGRVEDLKAALAQARRGVQTLEPQRHVPVVAVVRMYYFRETGDHAAALAEALNRRQSGVRLSAFDEMFLCVELYHKGEFDRAVEVIDGSNARGWDAYLFQIFRCYALAELPDGPARALSATPALKPTSVFAIYVPTIAQLLGRRSDAVAAYRTLREMPTQPYKRSEWIEQVMEYNCGLIPADRLLAAAGSSRLHLCEAHFFIGMALLADGDRDGARVHFRRSVGTHVIWYVDHIWSRAFLARLDADPNWPRWAPHVAPPPRIKQSP